MRVELRKDSGPVRAAALRIRCGTDRGWVIERQMRDWDAWVEWCAIPRLMPLDWDPGDEYAFVDEDYADHERDHGQDPPAHVASALEWDRAWELRRRAEQWRKDMESIREPEQDDVTYVVGNADQWAELLGLAEELGLDEEDEGGRS